jgi:predicted aldo/keto reductase-like oxidoreductase
MIYRRFGKTELQIPVFSCGGMRYQHSWKDEELPGVTAEGQANLRATVHRAFDLGINHIETARHYGTSEAQLASVLAELPRSELILQTKVPPAADPTAFEAELEKSFKNLQVDYIDLFAFHGVNLPEYLEHIENGCYAVALRWKQEGRIRHIGFSTHGPTELIVKAVHSNLFDFVNLHWYYFMQKNAPAITAAAQRDMGIFIISPSDKGGRLYDPPARLQQLCQPYSPMVFNDLFCLNSAQVHTLSLGAAKPEDFDEHLKVLPLLEAQAPTAEVEMRIAGALRDFHGQEWMNHWDRGLPQVEATPGELNLYELLRFHNLASALDMVEFGKMRYQLFGEKNHWFPGETIVPEKIDALLPALSNSPFPEQIIAKIKEAHALFASES